MLLAQTVDQFNIRDDMNKPFNEELNPPAVDPVQQRLTNYAVEFHFENIPAETVYAAKVRIIDTLGALMAGFYDEPSVLARSIAGDVPCTSGAHVIGTNSITTPDLAAFANGTAARSAEMNDHDRKPGGRNGHPSDVVLPVYSASELMHVNGREFISAVVLAYEIYMRFAENISFTAFDATNFCCLGTAVAAGRLMRLTPAQLSHCISMAVIPSNALNQTRAGQLSMWKAVASGHAGRSGIFAAMLAQKGMEGPYLPFVGKNAWFNHVSHKQLALDELGGGKEPFRIQDTVIKPRSACFHTLSSILAAERAAKRLNGNIDDIDRISVEIYGAKERAVDAIPPAIGGDGHHWWHPHSRESADHSTPYAVAATLMDGTVTKDSFDDAHLANPRLRDLLRKIQVLENPEFTAAYERRPVQHCTKVTVFKTNGERIVGEFGGKHGNLSDALPQSKVEEKFSYLSNEILGDKRVRIILDQLWNLEGMNDVADIAALFAPTN